jgi:hypothetical protein
LTVTDVDALAPIVNPPAPEVFNLKVTVPGFTGVRMTIGVELNAGEYDTLQLVEDENAQVPAKFPEEA